MVVAAPGSIGSAADRSSRRFQKKADHVNIVERTLRNALVRWKILEFLRLSAALGCVVLVMVLGLAGCIWAGWLSDRGLAMALFFAIAGGGVLALCLLAVKLAAETRPPTAIAADLERVDTRLRDRLNTLCFLQPKTNEPGVRSFTTHIQRQAKRLLAEALPRSPYSVRRTLFPMLAVTALGLGTAVLFHQYRPWSLLVVAADDAGQPGTGKAPVPPEPPLTNVVEAPKDWGEVRITDPGRDLKVTKVDVVPLQIEAAANEPFTGLTWYSAINGARETGHPLPCPNDQRFAVTQTEVYLDELGLSDWDVVTYYAKAETRGGKIYASEVYFLEVRPFREDILKMPGGEGGKPFQTLAGISGLVERQQHVIRETHRYAQKPAGQDQARAEERKKLASAETELAGGARHLYGKLASDMENTPIGEALDNLAKAGKSLETAATLLDQNSIDSAQNHERQALLELTAARKIFQKAVTDNPSQFQDSPGTEQDPIADSQDKLEQIAEFRNEAAAARDFVNKSAAEQKQLAADAERTGTRQQQRLAERQETLEKSLRDFQRQHPRSFQGTQSQAGQAQQAMGEAARAFRNNQPGAARSAAAASRRLDELSNALQEKELQRELADAYRLKQMLEQQMRELDQKTRQEQRTSSAEAAALAEQTRRILDELGKKASQAPTRQAFGDALREALGDPKRQEITDSLREFQQSRDENTRREQAARARDGLEDIKEAFEQSQPGGKHPPDEPSAPSSGGLEQAVAALEALLNRQQNGKRLPDEQARKQMSQALADIRNGLADLPGNGQVSPELSSQVERMQVPGQQLSESELRRLLELVQQFAAETSDKKARQEAVAEMTNIDPGKLPAAYRDRIQTYLQKLSEQ
jgi:hypothetical protein